MVKVTTTNRISQATSRTERAALRRYLVAALLVRLADEGARVALVAALSGTYEQRCRRWAARR
jgi:hypothetical protein